MRRRVFGLEVEHGCVQQGGQTALQTTLREMFRFGWPGDFNTNHWLGNGHRFYLDVNEHVENATGECDSPWEVTHHALAGDRNLRQLAADFEAHEAQRGSPVSLTFYRNNICNYSPSQIEDTYGCHENYQVEYEPHLYAQPLLAYATTCQLILGAGRLQLMKGQPPRYELAQRSGFLESAISSSTTHDRPIINLKNERHAGSTHRLHLIHGDNNILPQLTALKFGILDVLLTLIEEGRLTRFPRLLNPVQVVRNMSLNPGGRWQLVEGGELSGLDIQQWYFDPAYEFVMSDTELAPKRPFIEQWGRHLDRLRQSYNARTGTFDIMPHVYQLDWATKEHILRRSWEGGMKPDDLRLRELMMHQITGSPTLLSRILRDHGQHDEAAVELARTLPSPRTRAWARGQIVRHPGATVVSWGEFALGGNPYKLPDPLSPELPPGIEEIPMAA